MGFDEMYICVPFPETKRMLRFLNLLRFVFFSFHTMILSTKDGIEKYNTFVPKPLYSEVDVFSSNSCRFHGELEDSPRRS